MTKQCECDPEVKFLRKENARLREALLSIAEGLSFPDDEVQSAVLKRAREALKGGEW